MPSSSTQSNQSGFYSH
uniref:Uncharacterized protein n=1 Tax=Anguilla anguilla TaxID=7936 RepID=A0A0E9RW83_ANGAN